MIKRVIALADRTAATTIWLMIWLTIVIVTCLPSIDTSAARHGARQMMRNMAWCWLTSQILRWGVIAGVAVVVGFVLWRNS